MNRRGLQDPNTSPPPWHAMVAQEVLETLHADDERGLDGDEVAQRLSEYGPNELPAPERPSLLRRFLRQFHNTLIYVLLAAAGFTAFLEEWVDASVILGVIVINAIVGFIQEGKAERALESIRAMLSPVATVIRDGERQEILASELVPGDIVLLRSGDRVPADLRVLAARNVHVEEASLTGESEPVEKAPARVDPDAALGDRKSLAFSSTLVTSGRLRGVVVATGSQAEIGRISEMVSRVSQVSTPLLRKIDAFGRQLSLAILLLAAAIFLFGYFLQGFSAQEMFMAVVSLAVAAIPEGLPAIMTITLALGVQHMARHRAIVRRLPAVETLGSVTVACVDKTGTLTRNEMAVTRVVTTEATYEVTGSGYEPRGEFLREGRATRPADDPLLRELARAGLLASDALLREGNNGHGWRIEGTPTEGAVVVMAHKAGLDLEAEHAARPRLDVLPFESERRYMASLHGGPEGSRILYVKGAPERLLPACTHQRTAQGLEPLEADLWAHREAELANTGHRVLALAYKDFDGERAELDDGPGDETARLTDADVSELTLLGLVGIIDPPREEATGAIRVCHEAGVRVKMITGDHLLTARSIAAAMGIGDGEHAVTGQQLSQATPEELERLVHENDVFARSSPEHKLLIMNALQARGEVVAMTGDGVNDAPALKRADVGVAMGIKGSEAAKEASAIVLADDNFTTIERAVQEGRTIYDNLVKTILFLLPTNGAQSLVVISAIVLGLTVMPVTPVQILWVNMVSAVTMALALAFEPAEEDVMRRPPRAPGAPILSRHLAWRVVFVSALIAAASILVFRFWIDRGASLGEARTAALNTLVTGQLFYLLNARFLVRSSFTFASLRGNPAIPIAAGVLASFQLALTYLPALQTLFGTASLTIDHWVSAFAAGALVFVLVEIEKGLLRRFFPHASGVARRTADSGRERPTA